MARQLKTEQSTSSPTPSPQAAAPEQAPHDAYGSAGLDQAPPPDAAPVAEILRAAADALGEPLDHVRVHTDTDVAAKAGAAAVADGSDIHLHPSAVTADGQVSAGLLHHELVHVAQSTRVGSGSSVAALESEADQAAAAIGAGQSVDIQGSAGGGRALHKSLSEWFSETFGSSAPPEESVRGPAEAWDTHATWLADGGTFEQVTTEEQTIFIASDSEVAAGVERTEAVEDDGQAAAVVEATEVTIERSKVSLQSGSIGHSREEQVLAPVALSDEARKAAALEELRQRSSDFDSRIEDANTRVEELEATLAAAEAAREADGGSPPVNEDDFDTGDRPLAEEPLSSEADKDQAQADLAAELSALRKQLAADGAAREALNQSVQELADGTVTLADVEGEYEIDYTEAERKALGTKAEWSAGLDGLKFKGSSTEADGKTDVDVSVDLNGAGVVVKDSDAAGNSTSFEGGVTLDDGLGVKGGVSKEKADGSGQEATGEADLVYDEEDGLQGFKAGGAYTVTDDQGRSGTVGLRQTLTKDEVAVGVDVGGKQTDGDEKNGSSYGITVSPDVGIKLDAQAQPDGTYKLVAELYGKLAMKGSAESHGTSAGGKSSAGVDAGGSVGASFTYTRILSTEDAVPYLEELEAGESDAQPEFTQWGELLAVLEGIEGGALARSDAAADLSPGESYQVKGEVSADLAVKGSAFGVLSAKGEIRGSGSTTLTVARTEAALVIDSALAASLTYGAGGELIIGGGGAAVEAKETSTCGISVHAELDPGSASFQADFEALTNACDSAELIAAAEQVGARVTLSTGESFVQQIEVSFGPIKVVGADTSEQSENVVVGEDGLEGTTTHGGSGHSDKVQLGETDVAGSEEKDALDATIEEEGLAVEVSEERTSTGVDGGGDAPSGGGVLAEGLPKQLSDWLVTSEKTLETYKTTPAEFDRVLAERVTDAANWSRACWWTDAVEPWYALRLDLKDATPVAEYAQEWPKQALWLAQARALASFMAASHAHGFECWENMLRHWGETGEGLANADNNDDLGARTEWPPGSDEASKEWQALQTAIAGLPDALANDYVETRIQIEEDAEFADPETSTTYPGEDRCGELLGRVDALRKALEGLAFGSEAARSEMLGQVDDWRIAVKERLVEHLEDVEILLEEAGLPTSGLDPDDSEAALEREAVETALARLRKNKETEERMLEQIGGSSLQRADALGKELKDLWDVWLGHIRELRELPGGEDVQVEKPDVEGYIDALETATGKPLGGPNNPSEQHALDALRQRYGSV